MWIAYLNIHYYYYYIIIIKEHVPLQDQYQDLEER